ncbi:hypothetical protein BC937DRAFT_90391 [Endogone sp. FLAS-F59071]|nr:hypothetical protein BC937DRAFT_90391 [Endogone sp. FLAS-F59071]|eukprot:RUS17125.1 hypothetical protein BC937DRAFT_90391 [Endogone sp. FLAS-F59071]
MSTFRLILFGIRRFSPLCSSHAHSTASLLRPAFSLHPISSQFHTSPVRRSTPNIDPNIDLNHPIVRKLLENPKLAQNIKEYIELLSKKGIDVSGKTKPSTFKLMKIMMDPEVNSMTKIIAKDMEEAGIKLEPQAIAELIEKLRKD